MSKLIERLRKRIPVEGQMSNGGENVITKYADAPAIQLEAADEIERLERQLSQERDDRKYEEGGI